MLLNRSIYYSIVCAVCLNAMLGCLGTKIAKDTDLPEPSSAKDTVTGLHLRNPREVEGELTLLIKDIRTLRGQSLREHNLHKGLPKNLKPHLYVWSSELVNRINQRNATIVEYSIQPTNIYRDESNGNKIVFWDLTPLAQDGTTITLRRRIYYTAYETRFEIDPKRVEPYDTRSKIYRFYTKSEPLIEVTEEIRDLAHRIVGDEENPYLKAKKIFDWILENIEYKYPPPQRGTIHCLSNRSGDCGEFSFLFCALCRAEGIPARFVGGLWLGKRTGFHAWAEFHLLNYGWIPADTSIAQKPDGNHDYYYFGNLDNQRFIASVGTNLPIKPSPSWASYEVGDVEAGVTTFMQHSTVLMTGIEAKISRALRVIRTGPAHNATMSAK